MAINVTFTGIRDLQRALKRYDRSFKPNSRQVKTLFTQLGRKGRDRVKKNITEQKNFAPLAPFTRARTGRRKALITERSRIKFSVKTRHVEIGYDTRSLKWDLTKHHKGFTSKGTNKTMLIPLRNPKIIGMDQNLIILFGRKASVIPARPVWGNINQILGYVGPTARLWVRKIIDGK